MLKNILLKYVFSNQRSFCNAAPFLNYFYRQVWLIRVIDLSIYGVCVMNGLFVISSGDYCVL